MSIFRLLCLQTSDHNTMFPLMQL